MTGVQTCALPISGNGSGVIDRLRQLGHEVIEVNFSGKPMDAVYKNKRTEMWCLMAEWLKAGGAIPNLTDLKQDLGSPIYFYDSANKKCLESKDAIKARIRRSPDTADALALTFAFKVNARHDQEEVEEFPGMFPSNYGGSWMS